MFASDVDLVRLEPGLFDRVGWSGQRLLVGTGPIVSGVLTLGPPGDAVASGVRAGDVVRVGGVALAVVGVTAPDTVEVSRIVGLGEDPLPPIDQPSAEVEVSTFRPQISIVHRQVLRAIGIEPDGAASDGELVEEAVMNPDGLRLLEALGALRLVFSAAAALAPADSPLSERAAWYDERFADERSRAVARLDTDGDGLADATRRPSLVPLVRA